MRKFDKNITYQSMVDHSLRLFGQIFLANGAGVLALLTLIGHLGKHGIGASGDMYAYWGSVASFLLGVCSTMMAAVFSYLTQYRIFRQDESGPWFRAAIMATFVSLLFFVLGSFSGALFVAYVVR
ncbi:hypothetical protein ACSSZE_13225 [Acidithiobacillus caldus]